MNRKLKLGPLVAFVSTGDITKAIGKYKNMTNNNFKNDVTLVEKKSSDLPWERMIVEFKEDPGVKIWKKMYL